MKVVSRVSFVGFLVVLRIYSSQMHFMDKKLIVVASAALIASPVSATLCSSLDLDYFGNHDFENEMATCIYNNAVSYTNCMNYITQNFYVLTADCKACTGDIINQCQSCDGTGDVLLCEA